MQRLPAPAFIFNLTTSYLAPRCLYAVAQLGVADVLGTTPMSTEELAKATGAHADSLHRMLRLLSAQGVFERRAQGWAHTDYSEHLKANHPHSLKALVMMFNDDINWRSAQALTVSARTGQTACDTVMPGGLWPYLQSHPEDARIFDAAMTGKSHMAIAAMLQAMEFHRYEHIADIAGGRGHVLSAVLDATPRSRGTLFDLPHVVEHAQAHARMQKQGGDFFVGPLPRADAYIVSNILHDWADPQAISILRNIRKAAPAHAELLVLEMMLPEGPELHPALVMDIVMLSLAGGRERTQVQYDALFAEGGFKLDRVVPTQGPYSIIVGKVA
ncbi:acetylserotonin O-methyltransferase [Myxococcus fulvus]|uniref:acetylserotonin O-methyltransferase n=1 Tax=Myxococcus fulvus TaxID=33 RepID=UPI0020BFCA0F|nr:acetylserotonin O-methyltransferase [Myxococcus fulvus]MCK8503331.1 acetylserotonin O-methyltransferase [Myxococcus fulvus]